MTPCNFLPIMVSRGMDYDTVIIGAGAAGMMCATQTGGRTLVIDHASAPGEKIRISGGGRCNFTNMYSGPENFLSDNPHFCKSALARYTQWDFIDLVTRHGIGWHEKTLGQLFCDASAKLIIEMLRQEMAQAGADLRLNTSVTKVQKTAVGFTLTLSDQTDLTCRNLVLATGGKSIPKMGATGFAYDIARQFDHRVTDTRAGLVPLTFPEGRFASISGVATDVRVTCADNSFTEAMLFTHRGLSGPAILQISSYWREGQPIHINLFPDADPFQTLRTERQSQGRRNLTTVLSQLLPARLVGYLVDQIDLTGNLADQSDAALSRLCANLTKWELVPSGSEGYRTAEVTLGGVDTEDLSSQSMMSKTVPGLYFIGECVDVTGWLGGYNFQWAWSSGHAAGTHIRQQNG